MEIPALLNVIQVSYLEESDNLMLTKRFSEEEVRFAIWSCFGDKSLGLDGFNFRFVKRFWNLLKADVIQVTEQFHSHGKFPKGANASFLAFIPKKEVIGGLGDYRPISLIGSLYKILSKVLAMRLSKVVGKLVNESQLTFVGGRNVLDSMVVVNECMHEVKRRKRSTLIFKENFEKVYDVVRWDFLYHMRRMEFSERWIG